MEPQEPPQGHAGPGPTGLIHNPEGQPREPDGIYRGRGGAKGGLGGGGVSALPLLAAARPQGPGYEEHALSTSSHRVDVVFIDRSGFKE